MNIIIIISGLITFCWFVAFGIISLMEREKRAARLSFLLAIAAASSVWLVLLLSLAVRWILLGILLTAGVAGIFVFLLPIGKVKSGLDTPRQRVDERDIVFARKQLKPGSLLFKSYYAMRPENLVLDDRIRSRPCLLSPDAQFADPFYFASAEGSFFLTEALRAAVEGPVASNRHELSPARMTAYIKGQAKY